MLNFSFTLGSDSVQFQGVGFYFKLKFWLCGRTDDLSAVYKASFQTRSAQPAPAVPLHLARTVAQSSLEQPTGRARQTKTQRCLGTFAPWCWE